MRLIVRLLAEIVRGQRVTIRQQRTIITQLQQLQERQNMAATQEDVAALEQSLGTSFDQLTTALSGVSGDVSELKRMLEEAQGGGADLDLTRATELAGNIATVTQAFAALDEETPDVPPVDTSSTRDVPADSSGDSNF